MCYLPHCLFHLYFIILPLFCEITHNNFLPQHPVMLAGISNTMFLNYMLWLRIKSNASIIISTKAFLYMLSLKELQEMYPFFFINNEFFYIFVSHSLYCIVQDTLQLYLMGFKSIFVHTETSQLQQLFGYVYPTLGIASVLSEVTDWYSIILILYTSLTKWSRILLKKLTVE